VFAGINPLSSLHNSRLVTIYTPQGPVTIRTDQFLVGQILEEAGIDLEGLMVFPAPDEELLSSSIILISAPGVTIHVDGQELEVFSWAETVAELLLEQDIQVEGDIVSLPLDARIWAGLEITIIRVTREYEYLEESVAARVTYRNDATLAVGTERVQTPARDGQKKITYENIFHDWVKVARNRVGEEVIVQPVTGVILRGIKTVSRSTLGNSKVMEGIASFYGDPFHGRLTASGVRFNKHAMTAAHLTLPFGTRVRVTYLVTGKSVVVEINDRGPHIQGRIIDLSEAAAKAIGMHSAGLGRVRVEILN
jgi:rare lipoprotein A (peptidoglycan hydrolase)